MGIPREEILVWDPFLPDGGNTPDAIKKARLLLWKGHCSVHQMFQPAHVRYFREKHPGIKDRKSTRLNSSHGYISYAVFCLKKKKILIDKYETVLALTITRRTATMAR